jgi:uncharacterized RDD family membrane protein YckC
MPQTGVWMLHDEFTEKGVMVEYGQYELKEKRKNDLEQRVGFGTRLAAFLIDYVLLAVVGGVVGGIIGFVVGFGAVMNNPNITESELQRLTQQVQLVAFGVGLILQILYYGVLPTRWNGKTVGKSALNIRIVMEDGSDITFGRMFLRNIVGYFISWFVLALGFLWIIWDEDKQGWHDKIASTMVVQD